MTAPLSWSVHLVKLNSRTAKGAAMRDLLTSAYLRAIGTENPEELGKLLAMVAKAYDEAVLGASA